MIVEPDSSNPMLNRRRLIVTLCIVTFWLPSIVLASPSCDRLRNEPCEGEACLAKYKSIQDCETAVIAEEQARARRRQLQRQRDEAKRKKQLEESKNKETERF
jgi:hypothetical protein